MGTLRFFLEHLPPLERSHRFSQTVLHGEAGEPLMLLRCREWRGAGSVTLIEKGGLCFSSRRAITLWGREVTGVINDLAEFLDHGESRSFDHPVKDGYGAKLAREGKNTLAVRQRTPWQRLKTTKSPRCVERIAEFLAPMGD